MSNHRFIGIFILVLPFFKLLHQLQKMRHLELKKLKFWDSIECTTYAEHSIYYPYFFKNGALRNVIINGVLLWKIYFANLQLLYLAWYQLMWDHKTKLNHLHVLWTLQLPLKHRVTNLDTRVSYFIASLPPHHTQLQSRTSCEIGTWFSMR